MPNITKSLKYIDLKQDHSFLLNGDLWVVRIVQPTDPFLMDRTGEIRLATTDPETMTVYLSSVLSGDFLTHVLTHELGHCCMFSYGILQELHEFVPPDQWIEAEEWVCNFLADYGREVIRISDRLISKLNKNFTSREAR